MKHRGGLLSLVPLLAVVAGCSTGTISGSGAPGGNANGAAGGDGPASGSGTTPAAPTSLPAVSACTTSADAAPGPRVLRRLTSAQFNASLRDLFHDAGVPQASFITDPPALGFKVDAAALVVQDVMAQQLMDFTDAVATWVDTHPSSVASCTTTDAPCRHAFVTGFGKRAFRAPLTAAQTTTYEGLFAGQASFTEAVHIVVQAMLQSPYFLYRPELGAKDAASNRFTLTPYEVATSLAYFLTDSTPDDALLAAADAGELSTTAQLDAQIGRLLSDARSKNAVGNFVDGWLGVGDVLTTVKDTSVYGALTADLRTSMYTETMSLLLDTFASKGKFSDALTATYSFVDQPLASFYGIGGASGGAATKVTLQPGQRDFGLLAHGALLTGHASAAASSPVQRGKLVRTRLLCDTLAPPPGGVPTMLATQSAPTTTRARYEEHSKNAPCSGCHKYMDPVGFTFEHYDGIGRYRTQENGSNVDSTGSLASMKGQADAPLGGLSDLAAYLASSEDVNACMVRYWSYFAYGVASWKEDGCTQDAIKKEASANGFTMESVVRAIVHSPHFLARGADL